MPLPVLYALLRTSPVCSCILIAVLALLALLALLGCIILMPEVMRYEKSDSVTVAMLPFCASHAPWSHRA
jgi:hypothetical protein